MYTKEEVLQFLEDEDVKFIRLTYFDVFGRQKNVSVQPSRMRRAFEKGISIDATSVAGFENPIHTDLVLKPDPNTLTILPWRSTDGSVVYMICDIFYPDGRPFENDCRNILKRAVGKARNMGLEIEMAAKYEFYLMKLDEQGQRTDVPLDQAGYMDVAPWDRGENIRRDICITLDEMGMEPHKSFHQCGWGQNEVDFHFNNALQAADEAAIFKWVVRTTAQLHGLWADFTPRPFAKQPGNGLHIQIRFFDDDEEKRHMFMAGILKYAREMTLFFNPTTKSYERFGKDKAPLFINWSEQTRHCLLRVPSLNPDTFEVRSPDCKCSPYLTFALLIEAGLAGIEEGLELPVYDSMRFDAESIEMLPASLTEAARLAASSEFIACTVPASILKTYMNGEPIL